MSLDPNLSQVEPIQTFTRYFFKININTILRPIPVYLKFPHHFRFANQNVVCMSDLILLH